MLAVFVWIGGENEEHLSSSTTEDCMHIASSLDSLRDSDAGDTHPGPADRYTHPTHRHPNPTDSHTHPSPTNCGCNRK